MARTSGRDPRGVTLAGRTSRSMRRGVAQRCRDGSARPRRRSQSRSGRTQSRSSFPGLVRVRSGPRWTRAAKLGLYVPPSIGWRIVEGQDSLGRRPASRRNRRPGRSSRLARTRISSQTSPGKILVTARRPGPESLAVGHPVVDQEVRPGRLSRLGFVLQVEPRPGPGGGRSADKSRPARPAGVRSIPTQSPDPGGEWLRQASSRTRSFRTRRRPSGGSVHCHASSEPIGRASQRETTTRRARMTGLRSSLGSPWRPRPCGSSVDPSAPFPDPRAPAPPGFQSGLTPSFGPLRPPARPPIPRPAPRREREGRPR